MEEADTLATIAQISLGLAGFTGVVVSFDKINAALSRVDAFRLIILLSMSMGALMLALIPFGLHTWVCTQSRSGEFPAFSPASSASVLCSTMALQ